VPSVKERLKKRLMTKEVDVWNLVDNADPAEKQELVDAVRMLADPSGKGRAKLIEMYGARVEGARRRRQRRYRRRCQRQAAS
jgi:hypothetical protein